jgi:uroporphyrinogen-III synthase
VQKTLNSIQEIETSQYKKSQSQEIKYLMNLQIEFAKYEIYKTVNTHYKELNKIIKKTKNIVVYINALQI